MNIKKICMIPLIITTSVYATDYVSIIKKDKSYEVGGYFDEVRYTEWSKTGVTVCSVDSEVTDFYYGIDFNQTESCLEEESRIKNTIRVYENGAEEIISTDIEKQNIKKPETITTKTGTHLEQSCDNIISNGYASVTGLYTIGTSSDNFEVYCDMINGTGWTLIAKSPPTDSGSPHAHIDWFLNGQNQNDLKYNTMTYQTTKSAIGLSQLSKINHKNQAKFLFVSEDQSQEVPFFKTIISSNLPQWFKDTESTPTLTCINQEMTDQCETRSFENYSSRYWLRGMTLQKYGFTTLNNQDKDIHFSFINSTEISSSMCSSTGNYDGNAWKDFAADGHWGNALKVYVK